MMETAYQPQLNEASGGTKGPRAAGRAGTGIYRAPEPNSRAWLLNAELRDIAATEPETIPELIDIFLTDSTARLLKLDAACARPDYRLIRAEAHSLKGSSLQMGAARLAAACSSLELTERSEPEHYQAMRLAVEREFTAVRLEMEEYLAHPAPQAGV